MSAFPRSSVRKAVIPAAGLGTRFLPATKATPKEMLPVVDKPAIQYVVEEASAAGLDDVLMVTGRNKRSLEDHFDRNVELEAALEAKGDAARLEAVRASSELATIHSVRQGDPRGLGHAVLCGADHVGNEPFAVLLGDDLIDPRDPLLARMIEVREQYGGSVVALIEVDPDQISLYGCAAVAATDADDVVRITDLVEKPPRESAPSRLAVIGRYVLDPAVFEVLRNTPPGRGGEIQLTDALRTLAQRASTATDTDGAADGGTGTSGIAATDGGTGTDRGGASDGGAVSEGGAVSSGTAGGVQAGGVQAGGVQAGGVQAGGSGVGGGGQGGGPVHGVLFRGRRYDTGDKLEYLAATVRLACERDDIGPAFTKWLREYVASTD